LPHFAAARSAPLAASTPPIKPNNARLDVAAATAKRSNRFTSISFLPRSRVCMHQRP
jgi:hypothetical protein